MPPRSFTNPPPKTASALEARKSFFCELCQKGYSRQNEFSAHESSYDHQHKKRLKELKAMDKSMSASASKARKSEEKAAGLIKINPIALGGGSKKDAASGGFRKGGFKSAFGVTGEDDAGKGEEAIVKNVGMDEAAEVDVKMVEEDESEDEDDYYDPRRPTECPADCPGRTR